MQEAGLKALLRLQAPPAAPAQEQQHSNCRLLEESSCCLAHHVGCCLCLMGASPGCSSSTKPSKGRPPSQAHLQGCKQQQLLLTVTRAAAAATAWASVSAPALHNTTRPSKATLLAPCLYKCSSQGLGLGLARRCSHSCGPAHQVMPLQEQRTSTAGSRPQHLG